MKIAIITIHYANSYGGMLQAYASQKVLSSFGEVSFINRITPHLADNMRVLPLPSSPRGLLRFGKNIFRFFPRSRLISRFKDFQQTYFRHTPLIDNDEQLHALEDEFDIFICGSDQIWNPQVLEDFDAAYFLSFVKDKKKIAFASSAGSYKYTEQEEEKVAEYLSDFHAIGVREVDMQQYLTKLLGREDITTLLDPTLLLSKDEWHSDFPPDAGDRPPYLLVYALKLGKEGLDIISKVASQLGLKVITIDQDPFLRYNADEHKNDIGPKEYLELLAGASFVVTDSFHGTAFSVNFNVPFITILPKSGGNRIKTLLSAVGLEERLVEGGELPAPEMCFTQANEKLEALRGASLKFLEDAVIGA